MRGSLSASVFALALAAIPLAGQEQPARTPAPATSDAAKPVLLSGCLTGGPSSYLLSNVAVTRVAHEGADRPVGTSGASTSYSLTARDGVNLGDYVGKKVEVSGSLLPTPQPQEGAVQDAKLPKNHTPEAKAQVRGTVAALTDPRLAVTSVKLLSATCQ
jgi:hypothetical protein